MDSVILSYLAHWRSFAYGLVFAGMIIEGDIVLFTAAFMARHGFLNLDYVAVFALAGAFVGDALWYMLGRLVGHHINNNCRLSFLAGWIAKIAKPFDSHLCEHCQRSIFISKFAYGFHHIFLARLGMLRFAWDKLVKIDVIATFIWALIVSFLGYFAGAASIASKHYLRFIEVGFLLALAFFLAVEYFVAKSLKN